MDEETVGRLAELAGIEGGELELVMQTKRLQRRYDRALYESKAADGRRMHPLEVLQWRELQEKGKKAEALVGTLEDKVFRRRGLDGSSLHAPPSEADPETRRLLAEAWAARNFPPPETPPEPTYPSNDPRFQSHDQSRRAFTCFLEFKRCQKRSAQDDDTWAASDERPFDINATSANFGRRVPKELFEQQFEEAITKEDDVERKKELGKRLLMQNVVSFIGQPRFEIYPQCHRFWHCYKLVTPLYWEEAWEEQIAEGTFPAAI